MVLDLFSRFVVGWAVSAVNDRHVTIKALDMALKRRCPDAGLLHHSDQGCTYASEDYQTILGARGIVCSMSRRGNCYDCEHDRAAAGHQPTIDYVARRTAQGLSKKDIIRCLKRFVAREIYDALIEDHRLRAAHLEAA